LSKLEYIDLEFPTFCEKESNIYNFNRKRSIFSYRDSLSNLFCIVFDNSSKKGKFYTELNNLDETKIKLLLSQFIQKDFYRIYYSQNSVTGLILNKDRYDSGDYIRSHYNNINPYILEGKFFIDGMSASGECVKNRAIKFLINNDAISCGLKLVLKILKKI